MLQNKRTQRRRKAKKIANCAVVSISHSVHIGDPFEACLSYCLWRFSESWASNSLIVHFLNRGRRNTSIGTETRKMTDVRGNHFSLLLWMPILEKPITLLGINDELEHWSSSQVRLISSLPDANASQRITITLHNDSAVNHWPSAVQDELLHM